MTAKDVVRAVEEELANGASTNVQKVERAIRQAVKAVNAAPLARWRGRAIATYHTRVSGGSTKVSVRIGGQEACVIDARRDGPTVRPNLRHSAIWAASFGREASASWSDRRVKHFMDAVALRLSGRPEARIEAGLLRALDAKRKTGTLLANMKAVTLPVDDGYPLQVPVPVGAKAGARLGHADVLARVGRGRHSRLCVIELKAPGSRERALRQGVRYVASLRFMMRDADSALYDLTGLEKHPPDVVVMAVVPENSLKVALEDREELNEAPASGIRDLRVLTYKPNASSDRPLELRRAA